MNSDVQQAPAGYLGSKTPWDSYQDAEAKDIWGISQFAYEHGGLVLLGHPSALQDNRTTTLNGFNAYTMHSS